MVKTRGPRRRESATAISGTASRGMRVAVGHFCCGFAAADGVAAALEGLVGILGIWLWEGLYGCSFWAVSLLQRRCVQNSSDGGFLVCWGVDARPLPIKFAKKGFFYERNKNAAARGKDP